MVLKDILNHVKNNKELQENIMKTVLNAKNIDANKLHKAYKKVSENPFVKDYIEQNQDRIKEQIINQTKEYQQTLKTHASHYQSQLKNKINEKSKFFEENKLTIHYDQSENNKNENMKNIINNLDFLNEKTYIPNPLIKNFHLQSLYQIANSRNDKIKYYREIYQFKDKGVCSLDWVKPQKSFYNKVTNEIEYYDEVIENKNTKILFVIHGLTGGSNMNYVKYLCKIASEQGYRCVAYNSRGINTMLTTPVPFSGNKIDDIYEVIDHIKEKYPNAPMFGVGTSFGGNMLMRWVAKQKNQAHYFKGLIGLAVPFSVDACIDTMGPIYEKFFVNRYKANVITPHMDMLRNLETTHGLDLEEVMKTETLRDFHQSISVKIFGYKTVDDYFRESDVTNEDIQNIKIPMLLMQSLDDPIVSPSQVPQEQIYKNHNILYTTTKNGAHCCWFEGFKPKRWYPTPTLEFCQAIMENNFNNEQKQQQQIQQ